MAVAAWLDAVGFAEFLPAFQRERFDGPDWPELVGTLAENQELDIFCAQYKLPEGLRREILVFSGVRSGKGFTRSIFEMMRAQRYARGTYLCSQSLRILGGPGRVARGGFFGVPVPASFSHS